MLRWLDHWNIDMIDMIEVRCQTLERPASHSIATHGFGKTTIPKWCKICGSFEDIIYLYQAITFTPSIRPHILLPCAVSWTIGCRWNSCQQLSNNSQFILRGGVFYLSSHSSSPVKQETEEIGTHVFQAGSYKAGVHTQPRGKIY